MNSQSAPETLHCTFCHADCKNKCPASAMYSSYSDASDTCSIAPGAIIDIKCTRCFQRDGLKATCVCHFTQEQREKLKLNASNNVTVKNPFPVIADAPQAKFASGATRSEFAPRFHLLPPNAHLAWANRMGGGEKTHGAFNWLQGADDPAFQIETLNHLEEHLRRFKSGDRSDDHLAAIMCSAAFLREFDAMGKLAIPREFVRG